tara:strand:+ start:575 stop:736 length:162 start_codon:yes stop_codon:yes gene_type:complete
LESKKTSPTLEYFDYLDDEVLIQMAVYFPLELKQMCNLVSLDIQIESEKLKGE